MGALKAIRVEQGSVATGFRNRYCKVLAMNLGELSEVNSEMYFTAVQPQSLLCMGEPLSTSSFKLKPGAGAIPSGPPPAVDDGRG